uniref:Uncharacterized protein n=1 Tax=Arundo donax TaxID=35708 RepID=A0A0A9BG33_ARUDO
MLILLTAIQRRPAGHLDGSPVYQSTDQRTAVVFHGWKCVAGRTSEQFCNPCPAGAHLSLNPLDLQHLSTSKEKTCKCNHAVVFTFVFHSHALKVIHNTINGTAFGNSWSQW